MFCFQCQDAARNVACTVRGVCGKPEETANLEDLLIFVLKGMAVDGEKLKESGTPQRSEAGFIAQGLFATITNGNWDNARFTVMIQDGLNRGERMRADFLDTYQEKAGRALDAPLPEAATWTGEPATFPEKGQRLQDEITDFVFLVPQNGGMIGISGDAFQADRQQVS